MKHHAQLVRTYDVSAYVHPDSTAAILSTYYERLGINDVRLVTEQAQLRPVTNKGQVFVIATGYVTDEAQNALLKLFEEPPADTRFVLVVPSAFQLLATLQSRIGYETSIQNSSDSKAWLEFINGSYGDRLKQIEVWQKAKDQNWLTEITKGVHNIQRSSCSLEVLRVVQFVGQKIQTRGASNKMLLEHLALVLPLRK